MHENHTNELAPMEPAPSLEPIVRKGKPTAWWWDVTLWPVVVLTGASMLFFAIGLAQRAGWIERVESAAEERPQTGDHVLYICPMMCVAPLSAAGRCPVCEMELVPSSSGPVQIDAATRRILNIQTARATRREVVRTIRAVGELGYDESKLKTLSAYVDGRIEELFANFTGVQVNKGDRLALIYSPRLYASQIELLLARKADLERQSANVGGARWSEQYLSARRRLIELGMAADQIAELEEAGQANSRMHLVAPMSGTVIEKLAVEGQYLKEGEPIYRLADLSTVWLMLRLFPEDAAMVSVNQPVIAEVQSFPGQTFVGRVEFIFPQVDPVSRTVAVRVAMENERGLLRIGDYARAAIETKYILPGGETDAIVIPRDAVLMAGENSVVYVETEPGRFEMRPVKIGPTMGREVVIVEGIAAGDVVATRGNFLIDSQTQLAGHPSLIDPSRAMARPPSEALAPDIAAALASLTDEDRTLAMRQRLCVVANMPLGSMGEPIKVDVAGQPVFICCEGCRKRLQENPQQYLAKLRQLIETYRDDHQAPPVDPDRRHQP